MSVSLDMLFSALPVIITPGLEQEDGWIIIQRRVDASVSFNKNWDEYVAGFGDVDGNYWLGLEAIHNLTAAQPMSLQIDVVPFNIPAVSIPYEQFHVGDAASDYLLTITSDTTRDDTLYTSMNYHSGSRFSTYDRDNDRYGNFHCAARFGSGWWFNACCDVCLNGVYDGSSEIGTNSMRMHFLGHSNVEPIRTVTLKIRAMN